MSAAVTNLARTCTRVMNEFCCLVFTPHFVYLQPFGSKFSAIFSAIFISRLEAGGGEDKAAMWKS